MKYSKQNRFNRRDFLVASGAFLSLPLLESSCRLLGNSGGVTMTPPKRIVFVSNYLGMHPESFFPTNFGKSYKPSLYLENLEWVRDRLTVFSNTDHNMPSGHGYDHSFLSGIMPEQASLFPDGNISIDQMIATHLFGKTKYSVLNTCSGNTGRGDNVTWTRSGMLAPCYSVEKVYDTLFQPLSPEQKKKQQKDRKRDYSIMDILKGRRMRFQYGKEDQARLDQYFTSLNTLQKNSESLAKWQSKPIPKFEKKLSAAPENHTKERYEYLFDMITVALQADLTRVVTVAFDGIRPSDLGATGNYHGLTHNGKQLGKVSDLRLVEQFQLDQVSRFMKKLDEVKEPNSNGTLLDNTIVMFGSGMGYGGTHSCRNLPILVMGGGLKHEGHRNLKQHDGVNTPLCNLYLSFMHQFGIEADRFNISNGTVTI